MRSEERAGTVVLILFLLWGTLITEPFHVFTGYLFNSVTMLQSYIGIGSGTFIASLTASAVFMIICVLLLLLSRGKFASYIPCSLFVLTGIVVFFKVIRDRQFYVGESVAVVAALVIIALLHVLELRKALLWITDFSIYSIAIFLVTGLFTKPLGALGNIIGKILYINNGQSVNLAEGMGGMFGLPALLWGTALMIFLMLPVVYYSLSKRST